MKIDFKTDSFKKNIKTTIKASEHVDYKSKNSYAIVNFNHPTSIPRDENVDKHISNLVNEVYSNNLIYNNFKIDEIEEDILLILNNLIAKNYNNMSKEDANNALIYEIGRFESKINKCIDEEFNYYETILHVNDLVLETNITIGNVEFFTLEKLTKQMIEINNDCFGDDFFVIGETYAKTIIFGLKKYVQDRAQIKIKIALNMLKLIITDTYDFNLDYDNDIPRKVQYITIYDDNIFETVKFIGFSYPYKLTYNQLYKSRYLFGFLSSILKNESNNEFEERLITAIYWFSEALSIKKEKYTIGDINKNNIESLGFFNKKHKLLNLVTCLETLLVFDNDDTISNKISKSISILIANSEYEKEMEKFIKDIYEYRSKIVHRGIIMITDENLDKLTQYTRMCIFKLIELYVFYQDSIIFFNSK